MALRSPAVMSMSISRPGRTSDTSPARRISSSVSLPMALTTTTTSLPWRTVRATWSATSRMRSGSATDVPPNFWMTRATDASTLPVGDRDGRTPCRGGSWSCPASSPAWRARRKRPSRGRVAMCARQDRVDGLSTRAPQAWSLLTASATSVCSSAQIARRSSRRIVSTRPL